MLAQSHREESAGFCAQWPQPFVWILCLIAIPVRLFHTARSPRVLSARHFCPTLWFQLHSRTLRRPRLDTTGNRIRRPQGAPKLFSPGPPALALLADVTFFLTVIVGEYTHSHFHSRGRYAGIVWVPVNGVDWLPLCAPAFPSPMRHYRCAFAFGASITRTSLMRHVHPGSSVAACGRTRPYRDEPAYVLVSTADRRRSQPVLRCSGPRLLQCVLHCA